MQEADDDKPALAESISDDGIDDAIKLAAEDDAMALLFAAEEANDEAATAAEAYAAARFQRLNALTGQFKRGASSQAPSNLSTYTTRNQTSKTRI